MCEQVSNNTERTAFIIGKSCNIYDFDDLTLTFSIYSGLIRYCDTFPEESNCIVTVDLTKHNSLQFLRGLLDIIDIKDRIRYLFIKHDNTSKIPDLTNWFKVVILDQNISVLPSCIKKCELTQSLQNEVNKIKKREIKKYIRSRISEESKVNIMKPFRALTATRKAILRKELERYGKLEDVLKMLVQKDN